MIVIAALEQLVAFLDHAGGIEWNLAKSRRIDRQLAFEQVRDEPDIATPALAFVEAIDEHWAPFGLRKEPDRIGRHRKPAEAFESERLGAGRLGNSVPSRTVTNRLMTMSQSALVTRNTSFQAPPRKR